jgi:hypothetical protein
MSKQEIVLNPDILIPAVSEDLQERFRWWNDLFHKHSAIHNTMAFEENKLLSKFKESVMHPEVEECAFTEEHAKSLKDLSFNREINQCYLGLATMQLQELRSEYITGNSNFKREKEEV